MIYLVMIILLAPMIGAMAWNGLHGKGYKIAYRPPDLKTTRGKLIRLLLLFYSAALLSTAFISRYDESTKDGYRGIGRIAAIVLFFLVILTVSIFMRQRRNH